MSNPFSKISAALRIVASFCCLAGCAAEVSGDEAEVPENVAVSSEALSQPIAVATLFDLNTYQRNALYQWSDTGVAFAREKISDGSDEVANMTFSDNVLSWAPTFMSSNTLNGVLRDGTTLYMASKWTIEKWNIWGPVLVASVSSRTVGPLVQNASTIFYNDANGLNRVNKDGTGQLYLGGGATYPLGVEGSKIYYVTANRIRRMNIGGGSIENLYSAPNPIYDPSYDANNYYFTERVGSTMNLRIAPRAEGTAGILASVENGAIFTPHARDGILYWAENIPGTGYIVSTRLSDRTNTVLRTRNGRVVTELYPAPDSVYWIETDGTTYWVKRATY